jgi:Protein of unknown function (DUF998)
VNNSANVRFVDASNSHPGPPGRTTRALLTCGTAAGPVYVVVGLTQALTRRGYSLLHDDLSVLANGSLGWIQIASLIITGGLVVAFAVGLGAAMAAGRGARWAPRLLGLFGLGMVGAGIFRADPMNGFPAGTPAGPPVSVSWHGNLHFVTAATGFLGLLIACFVLVRYFAARAERSWARFSVITGVVFLAAFVGIASGSTSAAVVLAFSLAVVLAFAWIAAVAVRFRSSASVQHPADGARTPESTS